MSHRTVTSRRLRRLETIDANSPRIAGEDDDTIIVDASELGLRPGEWPETLSTFGSFRLHRKMVHGEQFCGMVYASTDGDHRLLKIWND